MVEPLGLNLRRAAGGCTLVGLERNPERSATAGSFAARPVTAWFGGMALTATIPLLWPEPVRRDGRVAYPAFMALSVTTLCYGVVNAARTALRSRGTA